MLNSPNGYVLNGGGNPGLVEMSKKKNVNNQHDQDNNTCINVYSTCITKSIHNSQTCTCIEGSLLAIQENAKKIIYCRFLILPNHLTTQLCYHFASNRKCQTLNSFISSHLSKIKSWKMCFANISILTAKCN